MSELTPWFPPEVKPVHEGRYECLHAEMSPEDHDEGELTYDFFWRDGAWRLHEDSDDLCYHQKRYWRGLSYDPSGKGE